MLHYELVNAFTDKLLSGNPVAVFFPEKPLSITAMQGLAKEMNLSETTFVSSLREDGSAVVRIFTPVNELPFAGHPLLGTALAVAIKTGVQSFPLTTAKGCFQFSVTHQNEWGAKSLLEVAQIEMDQPTPQFSLYSRACDLLDALGIVSSILPVEVYDVGPRHVFVGVDDEVALAAIKPDLLKLSGHKNLAAVCFCKTGDHWRTRMFSPAYGVAEDAATGSAVSPLALHLGRHGLVPLGSKVTIVQGIEMGRRSEMYGYADQSQQTPIFRAGGKAIRVARGTYADVDGTQPEDCHE